MKVKQYKTMLGEENIPMLVKEKEVPYQEGKIESPGNVVKMMREVFSIHKQTEEYLYEICLNPKNHLIGVCELAHGCIRFAKKPSCVEHLLPFWSIIILPEMFLRVVRI